MANLCHQHESCLARELHRQCPVLALHQIALVDAELCEHISKEQTVAMAVTAVSACLDAIVASELDMASSLPDGKAQLLRELGTLGVSEVGSGLPLVLEGKDMQARELLTSASLRAGQLCHITPAPATQVRFTSGGPITCAYSCTVRVHLHVFGTLNMNGYWIRQIALLI